MSTYFYLQCLDHDPPLRAANESGQHHYDLPQIREDIARREVFVEAADEADMWPDECYFRSNTVRFLVGHKKCRLGIVDEYGREHALTEQEAGQ